MHHCGKGYALPVTVSNNESIIDPLVSENPGISAGFIKASKPAGNVAIQSIAVVFDDFCVDFVTVCKIMNADTASAFGKYLNTKYNAFH